MDGDVQVLIERIEESFDIDLSSERLQDDSTFEDLCRVIRARVAHQASQKCFTSIVFWRLRRACTELFGIPKGSITPWAATDLILPAVRRRREWLQLSGVAGLKLPGLEYSSSVGLAIWWGSFVPMAMLTIAFRGGWWLALGIVLWPIMANALFRVLKPLANTLPAHCATFGDLAKSVVGLNYGKLAQELGSCTEAEVLQSLRYVTADLLGIDPHALINESPRLIELVLANDGLRAQV